MNGVHLSYAYPMREASKNPTFLPMQKSTSSVIIDESEKEPENLDLTVH